MTTIELQNANQLKDIIVNYADKLVVIDFYADWCAPCKMTGVLFEKEILPTHKNVVLVKVDADNDNLTSLSDEYNVKGIPRLILYHNKKKVSDITGFKPNDIKYICKTYGM